MSPNPKDLEKHDLDDDGFEVTSEVELTAAGRSPAGIEYLRATQGRTKHAWVPRNSFAGDGSEAARKLEASGILLFGSGARAALVKEASKITRFPPREIMGRVGHGDNCFAYPDTRVFTHDGRVVPVAFAAGAVCVTAKGSLADWKRHVLPLLLDQALPMFALFAAFAAPLLRCSA